jgi:hypothetical protein
VVCAGTCQFEVAHNSRSYGRQCSGLVDSIFMVSGNWLGPLLCFYKPLCPASQAGSFSNWLEHCQAKDPLLRLLFMKTDVDRHQLLAGFCWRGDCDCNAIRRLREWKTAPRSTNQERADDPAPAPTLSTDLRCSRRAAAVRATAPPSIASPQVPRTERNILLAPGPRFQRQPLRHHNQRHLDLTIKRTCSYALPDEAAPQAEQTNARGQRFGLCSAQTSLS